MLNNQNLYKMGSDHAIVVAGAGAAGLSASISAARAGAEVFLLERKTHLGGTVTHSLIHTLGGLYDSSGEYINGGLSQELAERLLLASSHTRKRKIGKTWTLSVAPEIYGTETIAWIAEYPNIHVLKGCEIVRLSSLNNRVTAVLCIDEQHRILEIRTQAIVDATGSAEITRCMRPALVEDGKRHVSAGLILVLQGICTGALDFPKGTQLMMQIREAVNDGLLPAICARAWLDHGIREDEVYIKLAVSLIDQTRALGGWTSEILEATQAGKMLADFLRQFSDFNGSFISHIGELGLRDSGGIRGEYRLTVDDVRSGRIFDDGICRCAWPIEFWDSEKGVSLEYLPSGQAYEIPLRALKVANVENLWAAGKCLSAEPMARASARVVGTCWAMGEAAGMAAALDDPNQPFTSSLSSNFINGRTL